jgi:anti-sigma factor RsiW
VTHLGDRLAAFVDGQLPHDARERVLAHLTACPECRAAAEAERAVKGRLAAIHGPGPSEDFMRRLLALAEPGEPLPPRRRTVDKSTRPPTVPVGTWTVTAPPGGRGGGRGAPAGQSLAQARPPGALRRRHRLQLVAAAGVGVAAVALGTAVAIGGQEQPGPAVAPGDWFAGQHAATTGGLPLADPAMSVSIGFADPGMTTGASYGGAYFGGVPSR